MLRKMRVFWECEQAQDLVEYALLLAFLCLSGAAFFISMGQLTSSIWRHRTMQVNVVIKGVSLP